MLIFILLSAALILGVVALVGVPLLRPSALPPAPWAAVAATGLLVLGSAGLYVLWSSWSWQSSSADSPQTMVARLARELEHNPQNLPGWLMLGRSYVVLQEYPLALRAYQRADRLSGGRSADALTGEAEALALGDEFELDGRAGRLIERALALEPDSGKALFYGAAVALRRGDLSLARERFARLLAMNPPPNVRAVLEQQIRALDERLATAGAGGKSVSGASAAGAATVRLTITAPAAVAQEGTAPLFVFVRQAGQSGPPLAAKRLQSRFPQSVTLTPADSMIPGRSFAAGQRLEVVARIARSGNPIGASGDPFGLISYDVGKDGQKDLPIDHITP